MTKILNRSDFELLISYKEIKLRVIAIAEEINMQYKEKNPLFIGILNGSFIFLSDLFKEIEIDCQVSFIKVTSYKKTISSGKVTKLIGLNENIKGRNVLIVEDIIDSGTTLHNILNELNNLGAKSIGIVSLLVKPNSLKYSLNIDFTGFEIEDKFVVGYGLDYEGQLRNSKDILVLKD